MAEAGILFNLCKDGSAYEPVLSVRFLVTFNLAVIGFQSVSGMGQTDDIRYINEGGRNGYPIAMRLPQTSAHKLTFKRGIQIRRSLLGALNPLSSLTNELEAMRSRSAIGNIIVLNNEYKVKEMYSFISQGMCEWTISDLDASNTSVLIESFTISHRGLVRIPIADITSIF